MTLFGKASGSPELLGFQLAPPLVLLKTAPRPPLPLVPTYTVVGVWGSMRIAKTLRASTKLKPRFTGLQLAPPLVLLNTPPPLAPAYRVLGVRGSMAMARMFVRVNPVFAGLHVAPPLVLLKMPLDVRPPPVPA